jgi:hypothetical protein
MNMEIILSKQCESLTGCLGRGFGYYIRSTKKGRFFGQRSKHSVPPDGHLKFILTCAQLAQNRLHIADIKVSREEVKKALYEARYFIAMQNLRKDFYDARDILNLKTTFSL